MRTFIMGACIAYTAALGCSDPSTAEDEPWTVVQEGLPGALMSIWGTSTTDIWAVGGDIGDGSGPMVLHFDGTSWERQETSASGNLWWVHGFAGGPVFLGGDNGMILRYENGMFQQETTPGSNTVFGMWGSAPDDVWAVGGAAGGAEGAFAWHYDGTTWTDMELPADVVDNGALWKIWGRGSNDVWLVGTRGYTLHYDGQSITKEDSGSTRSLFTVHANGERFAAVGGFGDGVILENDGTGWQNVTPPGTTQLSGVCLTATGGYAVGSDGLVMERTDKGWKQVQTETGVYQTLHATWIDPEGGVWAVGGQVLSPPLTDGVMIYKGGRAAAAELSN